MLLELIFTIILQNIPHGRTDGRTHKIPSPWAPVGAKNPGITIFDSLHQQLTWPTKPLKKQLGGLLNLFQDFSGREIADCITVYFTFPRLSQF